MRRRRFVVSGTQSLLGAVAAPALLQGEEIPAARSATATARAPFVVRAGEDRFQEDVRLWGVSPNRMKVSSVDTSGALAVFEFEQTGKGGPSLHLHHEQDEWFFVREGRYLFRIGDAEHRVGPGDSVFAPRGMPHTWAHLEDGPGRLLFLIQPAGLMEAYFRQSAASKVRPSEEENRRIHEAHGMTWLGPGITVP